MKLLFATAELAPLAQSGGLGDAVAGLAHALGARGHDVTCVLPGYASARDAYAQLVTRGEAPDLAEAGTVSIPFPSGSFHARWLRGALGTGVTVELLDAPQLYDRPGLYGHADDALRFIALSRAASYRCDAVRPDALVAHDWHAALAIGGLRTALDRGANRGIGGVQVVHNNAYQGRFPRSAMALTGLPVELFHPEGVEAWGELCLLKAGIEWADRIVAVSPTYAKEIQTAEFGEGLDGAYRARAHRLSGIANGIDASRFDPANDPALPVPLDARRPDGKQACRRAVSQELGLDEALPGRFCVAIGRFAAQKGWDVLAGSLDRLVDQGCVVGLLGDGDPALAALVQVAASRHPKRVAVRTGFDDGLARRLYAGADCVLIPSRFEPCGLVQRIAQRYGAVPVAHRVGGLADTIVDPGLDPRGGVRARSVANERRTTGVLFSPLTPDALAAAVARVGRLGDEGRLAALQRRLLRLDVSWTKPAALWEKLLESATREARGRL